MPERIEPERYEFFERPGHRFELDRRDFFALLGGGLVVVLSADAQESGGRRRGGAMGGEPLPQDLAAWLHIGESGAITVYTGKAEMGQNIRTSLSQAVSEELRCPLQSVTLVMGDTELTPFDIGTFGSRTTPTMAPQLRKAAACARGMLAELAARRWQTGPDDIVIADGKVTRRGGRESLSFGELTKGEKLVRQIAPDTPVSRPAAQSVPKVDGRDFVTGRHRYTTDLKRPGMLRGKVLRPAAFNAALSSLDTREAEAMPGVTVVHDGNFVGVAAPDEQTAARALGCIRAEWNAPPQPSNRELFDYLKKNPESRPNADSRGSIEQGLADAHIRLRQAYTVQYIAHAPLEPRAAVAEWNAGKVTVWTGSQRPFAVRGELMDAFHLPQDRVRVIIPDTGAAYGGKHTGECAVEAARLAKAAGKPVKLVWTREEEFTWAYFRPAGLIDVSSGVRHDGAVTAWEFHNYNSGAAGIQTAYDIPNQRIEYHPAHSPLRQGSYRALAATANHFARETHMDELAHAVSIDPLQFRLHNLKDERLRAVLAAAAEKFGWGRSKPAPGHGFGIAGGFEKGGYFATCAEVAVDGSTNHVRIVRVVEAFECGAIVDPDQLKNQIQGAVSMGIGGALFEAIEFDNGRILNPKFSKYRVPRFADIPPIEVVMLDRKDLPSAGAGETPICGIAPAVGNAIFEATGKRLRSMPLKLV